jgi:hypothetical protein
MSIRQRADTYAVEVAMTLCVEVAVTLVVVLGVVVIVVGTGVSRQVHTAPT